MKDDLYLFTLMIMLVVFFVFASNIKTAETLALSVFGAITMYIKGKQ